MKDAELVYSLYVQANPVPDPDLLPLSRDEAVLLTLERSPDMITEEQAKERQPTQPKSRRVAVVLSTAAILIVAVAGAAILVNGGTKPVAAADAHPVVVFDGTTCSYEGPMLIEEGQVEFSLTSSGDEGFNLSSIRMEEPALSQELEAGPVGADWATTPDTPVPPGEMSSIGVPAGDSISSGWLMDPGVYVLDCTTPVRVTPEHVWRIAQVEVVSP